MITSERSFREGNNTSSTFENWIFLHLNDLEYPSQQAALCQVRLKLAQWFWRRSFSNFVIVFYLFCYHLPLENGMSFTWTDLNSHHPRMLMSSLVEIAPVVLEEKMKIGYLRQLQRRQLWQRRTTDKIWSENLTWAFDSGELN